MERPDTPGSEPHRHDEDSSTDDGELCWPLRPAQSELDCMALEEIAGSDDKLVRQLYSEQIPYPFKLDANHGKERLEKFYSDMLAFCARHGIPYPFHLGYYLPPSISASPLQYYREVIVYMINSQYEFNQLPLYTQLALEQILGIDSDKYDNLRKTVFDGKFADLFKPLDEVTRRDLNIGCRIDRSREWNAFQFVRKPKEPELGREIYMKYVDSELGLIPNWDVNQDIESFDYMCEHGWGYPTVVVGDDDKVFLVQLRQMPQKGRNYQEQLTLDMLPMLIEGSTPKEIAEKLEMPIDSVKYVLSLMIRFGLCSFKRIPRVKSGKFAFMIDQNIIMSLKNPSLLKLLFGHNITKNDLENAQASLRSKTGGKGPTLLSVVNESLANVFGAVADYECLFEGVFPIQALSDTFKMSRLAMTCDAVVNLVSGDARGFKIPGVISLAPADTFISSPWMVLYTVMSFCRDKSPPVHIWPKGSVIRDLPVDLLGYTHVQIWAWKPYKVFTCDISSVIVTIQKLLETTSILVVGFLQANTVPRSASFPGEMFSNTPEEFMLDTLSGVVSYVENKETLEKQVISIQYGIPINNAAHCAACLSHISYLSADKWDGIVAKQAELGEKLRSFLTGTGISLDHRQPQRRYHFFNGKLV